MRSKSLSSVSKKNSVKELKFRLELDTLKDNLLKESNNFSKNKNKNDSSSGGEKKKYVSDHDTLCNYSEKDEQNEQNDQNEQNEQNEKQIHSVIRKMLDFKKTNKFLSQEILNKQKLISQKERIILQLKEELNFHLNENTQLKANYENISNLKSEVEKNRNGVSEFCKNLKNKFKSYVQIIDMYEEKISICHKERSQIIKSSESIIDMKSSDKY